MIHDLEMQAQEVRHVAGDVKRHDLTLAIRQCLVALSKTVEQHATLGGTVAFSHEMLPRPEFAYVHRQREHEVPFFTRKRLDALQLAQERAEMIRSVERHGCASFAHRRESASLSQPPTPASEGGRWSRTMARMLERFQAD